MKVEHKIAVIFFLALLAVGLVGSVGYFNAHELLENQRQVEHTYRVLGQLDALLLRSQDVERAARSFYITGKENDLEPYRDALGALNPALEELRELTADNYSQVQRWDRLQTLVNRNISIAQRRVDARRKNASGASVLILAAEDLKTGEELQGLIGVMREAENHLLDERSRATRQTARRTRWTLMLPLAVSLVLLLALYLFIRRDLDKRRRLDAALRASDAKFRGVLEGAPDALLISSAHGEIQMVNSQTERLFGLPREELVGRFIGSLVVERPTPANEGETESGSPAAPRLEGVRHGGELFPVDITRNPLDVGGEQLMITAIRDQTERQRAAEALQKFSLELGRSNAELERFAYVASHDLQEPLRMVSSYTQLLAKRYRGKLGADADEFIAYAVDGANRMQTLINDLLTLSRVGAQAKAAEPVDCQALLERVKSDMRQTIQASRAVIECPDPLPTVTGDRSQLGQVFQNLIGNAIKFRGADAPRVEIRAARENGTFWRFSVKDNGIGIDPQYFERIFIIFQRLHGKEQYPGTGIGLAICKKIVERHGGQLQVESQPGRGTTFFFTLPAGAP